MKISKLSALEIYDSRGIPTVGVRIVLENGVTSFASFPAGSPGGSYEAVDLRDGGDRLRGMGVKKAVENIEKIIAPELIGMNTGLQPVIDAKLIDLDGTSNKSNLGANAVLSVSMVVAKAAAACKGIPLYKYLKNFFSRWQVVMPTPFMVFIEGGKQGENLTDIQEYMIVPSIGGSFSEKMEIAVEVYYKLHDLIKKKGLYL